MLSMDAVISIMSLLWSVLLLSVEDVPVVVMIGGTKALISKIELEYGGVL